MAQVNPQSDKDILEERRKPQFLLSDLDKVTHSDNMRVRNWMLERIKKHESKLELKKWKPGDIVAAHSVEPEAIDVWLFYGRDNYSDLRWYIFRDMGRYNNCFSIMLAGIKTSSEGTIEHPLCKSTYAKT
ncbi:hypothetical protein LCGC14_1170750 [marine sediment metagenome]|uniref:Uncharacterized protein n=1 Tax=marine sediment metagenome TaxID=412755 RepID=A0A0F9MCV1_9ZZZZ